MPELPEVEDARLDLEEHLKGKRISECRPADDTKVIEGCTADEMRAALEGRTVEEVGRKGKHLWLRLSGAGPHLLIHLGMDGELLVKGPSGKMLRGFKYRAAKKGSEDGAWPPPHCKLLLAFSDGSGLAFDEWRRFGKVRLVRGDPLACEPLCKLGFDPLSEMPPLGDFTARLMRRKRSGLKAVLLDQAFAAGVGNWVADEVLYQARLHPEQPVADMGADHIAALHAAVRDVVATASAARADASRYPRGWIFHSRWTGNKDGVVDGRKMKTLQAGGRTSAYVPELQKIVKAGGGGGGGGDDANAGGGGKKRAAPKKAAARDAAAAGGGGGGGDGDDAKAGAGGAAGGKKRAAPKEPAAKAEAGGGGGGEGAGGGDGDNAGGGRKRAAPKKPAAPKAAAGKAGRGGGARGSRGGKRVRKEETGEGGSDEEQAEPQQQQAPLPAQQQQQQQQQPEPSVSAAESVGSAGDSPPAPQAKGRGGRGGRGARGGGGGRAGARGHGRGTTAAAAPAAADTEDEAEGGGAAAAAGRKVPRGAKRGAAAAGAAGAAAGGRGKRRKA